MPLKTRLAAFVASLVAIPAPIPLGEPMLANVVTATVPPVMVSGCVKVLSAVSVRVPVPVLVRARPPVEPSWMTPETMPLPLPVPTLSVASVPDEFVIVPALLSAPTVLRLTPLTSKVVP